MEGKKKKRKGGKEILALSAFTLKAVGKTKAHGRIKELQIVLGSSVG